MEFVTRARERYADLFEILYRIHEHAISLLNEFHVERDDPQGILVAGFFSRLIENVQASVVLSEQGFSTQSRVILRAAPESQFSLRACLSWEFCERLATQETSWITLHIATDTWIVVRARSPALTTYPPGR